MTTQAALVTTWGVPVPGRAQKALEAFMDFMTFIGKQAAEGNCSEAEVYFAQDGNGGFAVVRGTSDPLHTIYESDDNRKILARAQACVQNLHTSFFYCGDEELQKGIQIFSEVLNEEQYT